MANDADHSEILPHYVNRGGRRKGRIPKTDWENIVAHVRESEEIERKMREEEAARLALEGPRRAHFYRRCSHEDSAQTRLGLDAQTARVEAYFDFLKTSHPDLERGQWYEDAAVSGWKKRLIFRPAGSEMNLALRPGDHVIFAKVDRAFRNMQDFITTTYLWKGRKVIVHFADLQVDFSTAMGEAFLSMMVIFAQWEARTISERTREVMRRLKLERGRGGGIPPHLHKWAGPKGKKRLVYDEREREIAREVIRLHDEEGMSWNACRMPVERFIAKRDGRCERHRFYVNTEYDNEVCKSYYQMEKRIQERERARAASQPAASD